MGVERRVGPRGLVQSAGESARESFVQQPSPNYTDCVDGGGGRLADHTADVVARPKPCMARGGTYRCSAVWRGRL